jgi:membrane associated rhomboid family serine protease
MGIYNRDYYRESRSGGIWSLETLTPVVKYLIIANVVVFLLQIFVTREVRMTPLDMLRHSDPDLDEWLDRAEEGDREAQEQIKKKYPQFYQSPPGELDKRLEGVHFPAQRVSLVQEWFELDVKKVIYRGQVWRLLTHAFCHERTGVWHILINMLLLYWFGCTLESMYGSREFLLFYLTAAVLGGLAFLGLELYTRSFVPAIGASGAVMAVLMLYTVLFPRSIIYVCWVIPVEMRWLMALYVIWDLHPVLRALAGEPMYTGVAHAAHLGGLAFGFLYAKFHWRLETLTERLPALRGRWRRRPRLRVAPDTYPEPESDTDMERVDQLLQKIMDSGQASLTEEERAALKQASERIKNRSNRGR